NSVGGCNSDWRAKAVDEAEELMRQQLNDPTTQFNRVQFSGDQQSGQTCGYYERPNAPVGKHSVRFIVFIDGAGGQNPYIDDPSAPYPINKSDFALNWKTQCLDLSYSETQK
ncbi:MAG: hypothetical protein AB7U35_09795, partial [Sphingobium sp.]